MRPDSPKGTAKSPLMAFATALLAMAIAYLAWQLGRIVDTLPGILQQLEVTRSEIEPSLAEISAWRSLVPPTLEAMESVRKTVDETVPPLLAEAQQVRALLEKELPPTRESVDQAMVTLEKTRETVDRQLPHVIEESAAIRSTVDQQLPGLLEEVQKTRELVPEALTESKQWRSNIPLWLDDARLLTQEAGANAVTGLFKGVINAPVKLVQSLGTTLLPTADLSEEESQAVSTALQDLLSEDVIGEQTTFEYPATGLAGTARLLRKDRIAEADCRDIAFDINRGRRKVATSQVTLCLSTQGRWEPYSR